MFNAGLDIDLDQFRSVRTKAILFAAISFSLPLASGIPIGRFLGLDWLGAVLLGATYASQTLIAYPILRRLNIIKNRTVAIAIGATIFTDIAALLTLSVITGVHGGNASLLNLGKLIGFSIRYVLLILGIVPWLGKLVFEKFDGNAVQFQ
jgi:Kef-type K+ transport system membrane component KefB